MTEGGETIGDRIFAVRAALGGGPRRPMPQREFAALLSTVSGRNYDPSTISMMETGVRGIGVEEVAWLASIDPKSRGRAWLAWGDEAEAGNGGTAPAKHYPPAQIGEGYPVTGPSPKARAEAEDAERRRRKLGNGG